MDARLSRFVWFLCAISTAVARKGHMAPLGESGSITPMPQEMQGFPDPVYFLKEHVLKNKPLVMRGAALDMPATKLWSDAYMREKTVGDKTVVGIEKGKKETRQSVMEMTFEEYLNKYNDSDIYFVNSVPKGLTGDVIIPWPLQCEEYKRSFEDNIMWFSSGGTKSVIHHDGYENINCLLRGRKRFLFVNTTKYADIEPDIIDKEEGAYGTVDVEKVDLDKYPFYEGMEFFSVDMNEGDCVYSPKLWIHQVQSWGSNIAVNVWWFKEINDLVKAENCNREYDKSMTFDTIPFHKTTVISDFDGDEKIIQVLRHGISRLIFTTAKSKSVSVDRFLKIMINNTKLKSRFIHYLALIFTSLDANRNKKLEVADLELKLSEKKMGTLFKSAVAWMSMARLHNFPLAVDFSNDSYKTIKPFVWSEVDDEKSTEDELPTQNSKETKDVNDHDEL